MSQLGYYCPAILGALAAIIYAAFGRGEWSTTDRAIIAAIGGTSAALIGQLLMLAAQGIFAGALPVPFGRTLRGRICAVIGLLVLLGMGLGAMAALALGGSSERLATIFGGTGGLCAAVALGLYIWSVPTAKPDFAEPAPT